MNITYEVAHSKEDLSRLATVCLGNRLFEPDGLLTKYYQAIIDKTQGRKMCIVMQLCNGRPSGAIVCFVNAHHVNTFIKPGFRGMGLGTHLVAKLRSELGLERSLLIGVEGYEGYEKFYAKNFIYENIMHFSLEEIKQYPIDKLVVKVNFNPKRKMLAELRRNISKSI